MISASFCHDCGVAVGAFHDDGCDVEPCPECGDQATSCGCETLTHPRLPWTGQWPGDAECKEFGWWARLIQGRGWVRCAENDEGAGPDLNRLAVDARWDADAGRYVTLSILGTIQTEKDAMDECCSRRTT